ncbi:MAG: hypothetical protein AAF827_19080 [Cyanobacteria bacterium P01_D01_bin.6]
MSLVVCGLSPSINAAYQSQAQGIGVSLQAVYQKLNALEPPIIEALLRQSVSQASELIGALGGTIASVVSGLSSENSRRQSFGLNGTAVVSTA